MRINPLHKILSIIKATPTIGGLEISDSFLRFAVWDGAQWVTTALRLPPGIVVGGQIKDRKNFVDALKAFHKQIMGGSKMGSRISVVLSLSSIGIYTQIFTLPFIEGDSLDKAVQLNIQMISPLEFSSAYSGWQFAHRDADKLRIEILSAFISRKVIDDFSTALREAGFISVAVESRALSLTRLIKDAVADVDKEKSYIILSVDSSGIDVMVTRHNELHFDYFNSWRDIQGDDREVTFDAFNGAIIRNLHQVVNYYNSHWQEPISEILFLSPIFEEQIKKTIEENFGLVARELHINSAAPISSDWFVSLGSAIRGMYSRRNDTEISLLGLDAQEEFQREQVVGFLRFWRTLLPASMAILLLAMFGVNYILSNINSSLTERINKLASPEQVKEMSLIETEANEFNRLVGLLSSLSAIPPKTIVMRNISDAATKNNVTITRLYNQAGNVPYKLTGLARSQDELIAFKKDLDLNPVFANVVLPLANIKAGPQGVDFSLTFDFNPANVK